MPGRWTNLRQTVRLNTPGVPDGGFTLDVNGQRVMALNGIYYRDAKSASPTSSSSSVNPATKSDSLPPKTTSIEPIGTVVPPLPTVAPDAPPISPSPALPPLLGGLLSGLGGLLDSPAVPTGTPSTGGLFGRQPHKRSIIDIAASHRHHPQAKVLHMIEPVELIAPRSFRVNKQNGELPPRRSREPPSTRGDDAAVPGLSGQVAIAPLGDPSGEAASPPAPSPEAASMPPFVSTNILAAGSEPAFGFTGIFFSTFFGGHDPSWATPKDQYMWFKGFALTMNA